jgi:RNA polymerase sigma-70 factor, ECF subfamily
MARQADGGNRRLPDGLSIFVELFPSWSESWVTAMETFSDIGLLARMTEGDERSFAVLYRRHGGPVYRFALHMSGDRELAEDVVQEVFMALMRDPRAYDASRGALGTYLCGIARNHVLRRLERKRGHEPIAEGAEFAAPENHGEDYLRAESVERLRRAVLALPAKYREVVVLCDLEEMDYSKAAETLGCPAGTVRSRLHRARRLLAGRLGANRPARCFA